LILSRSARNLARDFAETRTEQAMKSATAIAIVLATASLSSAANAQSAPGQLQRCTARVVYSEELPFAPIDTWLVKVTLEITPHYGVPYITTLQDRRPWQGHPPRRGQAFRLWCDPANPNYLQLMSGAIAKSAF
jgi:hypothetical protein